LAGASTRSEVRNKNVNGEEKRLEMEVQRIYTKLQG